MRQTCLLMAPSPTSLSPKVLKALSTPICNHLDSDFIGEWKETWQRLRLVFGCRGEGAPFPASGNGTLAMDMAAANLLEPEDTALVVNTGLFSDRFAATLQGYGQAVAHARAPRIGDVPSRVFEAEARR